MSRIAKRCKSGPQQQEEGQKVGHRSLGLVMGMAAEMEWFRKTV